SLSSLFFPPSCLICEEYLSDELFVCNTCLSKLQLHKNSDPGYIAVFQYNDSIKKLIFELKYNSRPEIGQILGKEAAKHLSDIFQNENSILLPVPLHKKRIRKRGYNQSLYIAQGISEGLAIPIKEELVKRRKNNVSQTKVDNSDRKSNVSGIFKLDTSSLDKDIFIIVVDDLITTQATTKEIYKTLKEHGYNNFFGLCIATSGK
nr:ComF family protein [Candidatus Delongbacteria bacterium]